ncbi:alpha/beta fold hydrolase [Leucobacter sp. USHLN154]|uniref:alpha/beta fold hydrolase n=1 Tax=Leucobacter sp. USHLN154 TaxID=3081269 RepID=UPI0030164A44
MTAAAAPPASDDEFRFLDFDARRVGRAGPLPAVARIAADVADHRAVSGLAFDGGLPPEIVALHGAGLNAHSFDPTLLALGRPALALDLPGHGRSDWRSDGDYRPDALAADVVDVLERVARRPVTLLGHSLGGLTAALIAAMRPDLVRRVILVDITPGVSPARDTGSVREFIQGQRDFSSIDEIVQRAQRFGIGHERAALERGIALNTRLRPDGRLEWAHHLAHLEPAPRTADGEEAQPYAPIWGALERLRSLDVPVALIAADAGILSRQHIAEWEDRLPSSAVVTIHGSHNLHEAAPLRLAEVLDGLHAKRSDAAT